jgi:hypothetical protein
VHEWRFEIVDDSVWRVRRGDAFDAFIVMGLVERTDQGQDCGFVGRGWGVKRGGRHDDTSVFFLALGTRGVTASDGGVNLFDEMAEFFSLEARVSVLMLG